MKLSIIIPFYNEEESIKRTLINLKQLERNDVEFIFVDDGSTDNTLSIIKNFDLQNKNLIVLNHKGVSVARNAGIDSANGKYILFMDADDTLEVDIIPFFLKCYNKNYDLIKFGYNYVTKKTKKVFKCVDISESTTLTYAIFKKFYTTNFFNSACFSIEKKSILRNNCLYFNSVHAYAEDYEFNRNLLKHVNNIYISDLCFYNYHYNKKSVTESNNLTNTLKNINDALEVYNVSVKECVNESYLDKCIYHSSHEIGVTIIKLFVTNDVKLKKILKCIKDIKKTDVYKEFNEITGNYKTTFFYRNVVVKENIIIILLFRMYYLFKFVIKKWLY